MAHRLQHAADLAFSAFVERHLQEGGAALPFSNSHDTCLGCLARLTRDHEALGKRLVDLRSRGSLYRDDIDLSNALARVGHLVDKVTIIGEEHEPLRVRIKTTGGLEGNPRQVNELRDDLLGVRIRDRGDIADRLMEGDVVTLPWHRKRLAIDDNLIFGGIDQDTFLGHRLAVHAYAACGDELLSASAGGDPGVGDRFL